jgi:hypothetical protein
MSKDNFVMVVVRRTPVREALKPLRAAWLECGSDPDWAAIAEVTGPKGYEAFELLVLKTSASACVTAECHSTGRKVTRVGSIAYDTLQIAKGQAHADLGIEYVEWEPCDIEITGEENRVYFEKALPLAEQVDAPNERR